MFMPLENVFPKFPCSNNFERKTKAAIAGLGFFIENAARASRDCPPSAFPLDPEDRDERASFGCKPTACLQRIFMDHRLGHVPNHYALLGLFAYCSDEFHGNGRGLCWLVGCCGRGWPGVYWRGRALALAKGLCVSNDFAGARATLFGDRACYMLQCQGC